MRDYQALRPPRSRRGRSLRSASSASLFLLLSLLAMSGESHAQRIRVLEADTLRSSGRRSGDLDVIVDVEADSGAASVRIGTSRWKRGGEESASLVRFGEDIIVEVDDVVDGSVVAFGGDVVVRGRILEDVVSFGGDVTLEGGAVVEGDAAAFGGTIERLAGSELLGEEVDVAFVPADVEAPFRRSGGGRTFWLLLILSAYLFLGLAGLASEWTLPDRVRRMSEHARAALWSSFFAGVAVQVLFGPALVLLCVTIIGIPVAVLLPVAYVAAQIVGFLAVVAALGARFSDGSLESRAAWIRAMLSGLGSIAAVTLSAVLLAGLSQPLAGIGKLLVLSAVVGHWTVATIGLGAVAVSRFGRRAPRRGGPETAGPNPAEFGPGRAHTA